MIKTILGIISGKRPIASTALRSFDFEFLTAITRTVPRTAQIVAALTARKRLFPSADNPFELAVNSSI